MNRLVCSIASSARIGRDAQDAELPATFPHGEGHGVGQADEGDERHERVERRTGSPPA
jgi:hypothetical protein